MQRSGEGHYRIYLKKGLTKEETLYQLLPRDFEETRFLCQHMSDSFVQTTSAHSSPSDATSVLLGAHHSPISGELVLSHVYQDGDRHLGKVQPACGLNGLALDLSSDYLKQGTTFFLMVLVQQIASPAQKDMLGIPTPALKPPFPPIDVHLETDLVMYRMCLALAELYGLRFRLFPSVQHPKLDLTRYTLEKASIEGAKTGYPVQHGQEFQGDKEMPVDAY